MSIISRAYVQASNMSARALVGAIPAGSGLILWNAAQTAFEQQRSREIAAESHAFCEKWATRRARSGTLNASPICRSFATGK